MYIRNNKSITINNNLLTMAELKAECPDEPRTLAVAPVMMIEPWPLVIICLPTSLHNRNAERAAISQT